MKQILATLSFFTRLPFWRLTNIPARCYERVVPLWPLAGWLTGGAMLLTLWISSYGMPLPICIVLMLTVRVLITGALHEDGFADFCDGFGGGTDRESTLKIMKDSHIGTYGVLGLVLYFLLLSAILISLLAAPSYIDGLASTRIKYFPEIVYRTVNPFNPAFHPSNSIFPLCLVIPLADIFAKFCSSWIIEFMPYARTKRGAKTKLVYSKSTIAERIACIVLTAIPIALAVPWLNLRQLVSMAFAALISAMVSGFMFYFINYRLDGYTGDCCGATFIITELVFHFMFLLSYYL